VQVGVHVVDGVDVRQIAFVVLEDQRHFVRIEAIEAQIRSQVFEAIEVRLAHGALGVGDEHHAVRAAQDELAGGVVEDLSGDGVELHADFLAADGSQLHGHEVKEEGAVRLRGHGDHFSLVLQLRIAVNLLEVGRLSAQPGPVVHQLDRHLVDCLVDQNHAKTPPGTVGP
jgi:hypothetical protein